MSARDDCKCVVKVGCEEKNCVFHFEPAALETAQDQQIHDLANAVIERCKNEISHCWPGTNFVRQGLKNTLAKVRDDTAADAATWTSTPQLEDIDIKCISSTQGAEVEITLCVVTIQLLPKGAGLDLVHHEDYHVDIQHLYCRLYSWRLKKDVERLICAKQYQDEKSLRSDVEKQVIQTFRAFKRALGSDDEWHDNYHRRASGGNDDFRAYLGLRLEKEVQFREWLFGE